MFKYNTKPILNMSCLFIGVLVQLENVRKDVSKFVVNFIDEMDIKQLNGEEKT